MAVRMAGSFKARLEPAADGPGLREWLDSLPPATPGCRAATFDTRLSKPLSGSAARSVARRLRRNGYQMAAKPAQFVVTDMTGPLRERELDRARAWGAQLSRQMSDDRTRMAGGRGAG
jgi:hypothetical protein